MIYQTQSSILSFYHDACYFCSIYYYKDILGLPTSLSEAEGLWISAINKGIIDSNFEIVDPQGLIDLMELPLKYRDAHYPPTTPIDPNTYVIEEWQHYINQDETFYHFMVGDGKGNIIYDPIEGGSQTHKFGHVYSLRLFDIV